MKFLALPGTNNLIVNIELTKIKIAMVINLKWPNLDYPCVEEPTRCTDSYK